MTTRPEDFDPATGAKLKHLQCEGCEDFCTFACTKCPDERVEVSMPCSNVCDGCADAVAVMVASGPIECEYHPGQFHDPAGCCTECERDGYDPEDN